jgi:hypothetical protein
MIQVTLTMAEEAMIVKKGMPIGRLTEFVLSVLIQTGFFFKENILQHEPQ